MKSPAPLLRDERGATAIEFAILAPVLCLFMTGIFDVAHTLYTRSVLQGVVQKTARDATLEDATDTASQAILDEKIRKQVRALANNSTIAITRRYYRTFSDAAAAQAEPYTDTNSNGTCNGGEPYTDKNNNGVWDRDGGDDGQGGAKDKTVYTVKISFDRMFPLWKFIGGSQTSNMTASTVLMNQPYTDQGSYTVTNTVRYCA
ncbi:MAG TPA: TadE/TadG family type IV pilus assembly protein [Sphingomicrobium sp.]